MNFIQLRKRIFRMGMTSLVIVSLSGEMQQCTWATDIVSKSVETYYTGATEVICGLNVLSESVRCKGSVRLKSGYAASLVLKLQRSPKNTTSWSTIKTWTGAGSSLSRDYAVSAGYKYRAVLNAKVYNSKNVLVDNATVYSNVFIY